MKVEEEVQIIRDAVDTYGFESQRKILQEECAELIVAASHYDRGRPGAYDNFLEELADVDIMISQMVYALQGNIDVWKEQKLTRLKDKIKKHKKEHGTA